SAVVALLKPHVPVLSLGALYVLAVLPAAILWGPSACFAIYLAIAFAVSALAARARARREDAEQRRAEAHALAEVALDPLRGRAPPQSASSLREAAAACRAARDPRLRPIPAHQVS